MERQGNQFMHSQSRMKGSETINMKKIISRVAMNWKWFALSLLIAMAGAIALNRYSKPVYEASTLILLETDRSQRSTGTESLGSGVFEGLGMTGSMRNINNQAVVLGSTPIIEGALNKLDFEVSYYRMGRIRVIDEYKNVPFIVEWDDLHVQPVGLPFNLHISPERELTITASGKEVMLYDYNLKEVIRRVPELTVAGTVEPDSLFESADYSFSIRLNENFDPQAANDYQFVFNTKQYLLGKYRGSIYVAPSFKETSILQVTARDNNIFRAIDFLDKVAEVYQQDNLDRKNKNAQRTMDFISSQLQNISDSLWISENELQQFQTKTNVMNISFQSQQVLEQMNELDKEKSELENRNKYYTNLKEYINSGQNLESIIAPSAIGIADPLLNSLINDLNKLEVTKSTMTFIKDPDHPKLKAINSQIESIKNTMLENANNILAQSQIALADVNVRLRRVQAQVNSLPATERNYVTIERKYKLNSETYNFLLEKFSEAQIAKASNYPDSQVIESASFSRLVSPDKRKNYSIALLLGLLLPGSIIFLKEFLSKKISSVEDIKSVTSLPILGYIFQNLKEDSSTTLLLDKPNSPACEPYRAVRSKLNLIAGMNAKPVIAVTSTFPQEGKSYNAINIASSFAMLNKKTVLLDLDLRNSKIRKIFQIESDEGVVNYILGKSTLTDITFNSKHQYLSIIPAGPYPSEPGEMFANDRVTKLLHELKELYDVIIIDSLPVGLFPDLFYLREEIDVTIYVVRHQFTHNEALKAALDEVTENKMKGVNILVNYVKHGKRNFGYGYEYGHIYGYRYSYSNDGQKKGKKKNNEVITGTENKKTIFRKKQSWILIPPVLGILVIPVYLLSGGYFTGKPKESGNKQIYSSVPPSDTILWSKSVSDLPDSIQSASADTFSGHSQKKLYYLIGGSFTSQQKADKFIKEMTDMGFHPQQLNQAGNYFRVALDTFSTKRDADLAIVRLRDTSNIPDAWVYHPGN